ncbi:hypothetical protein FQR65_LT06285 [Abscondita terminalis]|nr:hypothetical protein FQR65_LT06285 [Abscondita terminalis]
MVSRSTNNHRGKTKISKRWKTSRRTKDLDQIDEDIKPQNAEKLLNQDVDFDRAGNAQFYCLHCARYFINDQALQDHFRTKVHKRRLKALELEPYTIEESERAAGFGDKAQQNFALLTPILDFEERFRNRSELEDNIKLRKIFIDLDTVESRWNFFKYLEEQKDALEYVKGEIGKHIMELQKVGDKDEIEKLKVQGKLVKDDLKSLRDFMYGVEESAAMHVLSLPNVLHKDTPEDNEKVIYQYLDCPSTHSASHMEVGHNLIQYENPYFYFFKKEAALFEYAIVNYASEFLSLNFLPFSNSDFCRSIVVEGCGRDFEDASQVFTLEKIEEKRESHTHLIGAASLESFMAYFTKHIVLENKLPLRLFTTGKKYAPPKSNTNKNLFNVTQETSLDFFVATKNCDEEMEKEFRDLVSKITEFYEPLQQHFRLVYLPAKELKLFESLRLSVQMYSNSLEQYVEVGHCSICDSFLSKRLLFNYNVNKEWRFPKVIWGSLLRVPPMLACVLENNVNTDKNLLNEVLKRFVQ